MENDKRGLNAARGGHRTPPHPKTEVVGQPFPAAAKTSV
jgi:hypothetical protein